MTDVVAFYVSWQCFPQEQVGNGGRPNDDLRKTYVCLWKMMLLVCSMKQKKKKKNQNSLGASPLLKGNDS